MMLSRPPPPPCSPHRTRTAHAAAAAFVTPLHAPNSCQPPLCIPNSPLHPITSPLLSLRHPRCLLSAHLPTSLPPSLLRLGLVPLTSEHAKFMAMPYEGLDEFEVEFSLDVKCTEDAALEVLDTDLQPIGQHQVTPVSVRRGMADKPITLLKLGKGQVREAHAGNSG